MRRVQIVKNLKQSINDILGTDYGDPTTNEFDSLAPTVTNEDVYELTPWSIQAAMISNLERLCAALVDNPAYGKVLTGLTVTASPWPSIDIAAGKGVTTNGKLITLTSGITYKYIGPNTTKYVYLHYYLAAIDGDNDDRGRNSAFMGGPTKKRNLVYDELGMIIGGSVNAMPFRDIIITTSDSILDEDNVLLVATVVSGPSSFTSITMNAGLTTLGNVSCAAVTASGNVGADTITASAATITDVTASGTVDGATVKATLFATGVELGDSGSFTDAGGQIVTVTNGIITNIATP